MKVDTKQHGAVTVLKPIGGVTQEDAEMMYEHISRAIRESHGRIVLDISEVPFFDSLGLEALANTGDELRRTGGVLLLCGVHTNVREVLNLTDLDGLFEYFDDVNSAVRSFL